MNATRPLPADLGRRLAFIPGGLDLLKSDAPRMMVMALNLPEDQQFQLLRDLCALEVLPACDGVTALEEARRVAEAMVASAARQETGGVSEILGQVVPTAAEFPPGSFRQQLYGRPDLPGEWLEGDQYRQGSLTMAEQAQIAEQGQKRILRGKHSGGPQG